MQKIIIVESPSKSKTIESYMGSDYKVLSSLGHIRDLATSGKDGLGIDIENDFKPNYVTISGKTKLVSDLKKACKGHEVYLATDPDREGEAISYHLATVLGLDLNSTNRIEFHEITKPAILEAFNHPRSIDINLVYSQETRRMLDRIIGFKCSKLLQRKIKSQSAGRVQSVALKLIVDLEEEIKAFIPEAFYTLKGQKDNLVLEFVSYKEDKKKITSKDLANEIYNSLNKEFIVSDIITKEHFGQSKPPFTTSTLQQEASTRLGFSAQRTMRIAQSLYEGKKVGSSEVGLITYMRTDSTHLSTLFVNEANKYIKDNFGDNYLGNIKERHQALAQEAHEAIRPTSVLREPEKIKSYLTLDEYKLYSLIYKRALSSLMAPSKFSKTTVLFKNEETLWKSEGQELLFDGYLKLSGKDSDDLNELLPSFKQNDVLTGVCVSLNEEFSKPKSRYSEASLIKDMEKLGIGRPSTYATTLATLTERKYVEIKEKKLVPTEQGIITTKALDEYFNDIFNVKYTASMEETLDKIARGEAQELDTLSQFYKEFEPLYNNAMENMEKIYPKPTDLVCPECGGMLVIRKGRYGEFISCSNYPKCKYIKAEEKKNDAIDTTILCPKCGSGTFIQRMALKGRNKGNYFYACSNYPKCKNIVSDEPTNEVCPNCGSMMLKDKDGNLYCSNKCGEVSDYNPVLCPKCGKGHLVERKAMRGKNAGNYFYACDNFPRCKNIYNFKPTSKTCSLCGSILVIDNDNNLICSNEGCPNNKPTLD